MTASPFATKVSAHMKARPPWEVVCSFFYRGTLARRQCHFRKPASQPSRLPQPLYAETVPMTAPRCCIGTLAMSQGFCWRSHQIALALAPLRQARLPPPRKHREDNDAAAANTQVNKEDTMDVEPAANDKTEEEVKKEDGATKMDVDEAENNVEEKTTEAKEVEDAAAETASAAKVKEEAAAAAATTASTTAAATAAEAAVKSKEEAAAAAAATAAAKEEAASAATAAAAAEEEKKKEEEKKAKEQEDEKDDEGEKEDEEENKEEEEAPRSSRSSKRKAAGASPKEEEEPKSKRVRRAHSPSPLRTGTHSLARARPDTLCSALRWLSRWPPSWAGTEGHGANPTSAPT